MKVLLHACCGPCLIEPGRIIEEDYCEQKSPLTVYFDNPNIHPETEYRKRLEVCTQYVQSHSWHMIEGRYDPETWRREVGKWGEDRANRCRSCYRLRFERLADVAKHQGYDAISSTLPVSPYQDQAALQEELERAASKHGVKPIYQDFSDRYQVATTISRELEMYRQNYCGCEYSIKEAEADRKARKALRLSRKVQKDT